MWHNPQAHIVSCVQYENGNLHEVVNTWTLTIIIRSLEYIMSSKLHLNV